MANLFKQAAKRTEEQVIVSTQSAQLVNEFEPEDVIVVDRTQGKSVFRRLESAKLSGWLEDYSLGELWQKNVFAGGPRNEAMRSCRPMMMETLPPSPKRRKECRGRTSVTRVNVIVEGRTEQAFVQEVLAPFLLPAKVYLGAIILGVPGHKGGRANYARVKKDVLRQLKSDRTAYCSTMLDYYGLGKDFPGKLLSASLSNPDKVIHLERAMKKDIIAELPDLRADSRFLPYLQLHEYEGLLFSDPEAFANGIHQSHLTPQFQAIRQIFPTPEDIDERPDGAPSKRVIDLCPSYDKVLNGKQAASAVGIEAMRHECPHFRAWVESLGQLGTHWRPR